MCIQLYCQEPFYKRANNKCLRICGRALKSDNVLYWIAKVAQEYNAILKWKGREILPTGAITYNIYYSLQK